MHHHGVYHIPGISEPHGLDDSIDVCDQNKVHRYDSTVSCSYDEDSCKIPIHSCNAKIGVPPHFSVDTLFRSY